MSALSINIDFDRRAAPALKALLEDLDIGERVDFFESLSDDLEIVTREHITKASQTRHKSAARLGAQPTGYLEKIASSAEGVRGAASPGGVRLTLQGDIFKRAFGPVTVSASKAKALTLPMRAEAYGRRAREFNDLFVYKSKRGQAFLARSAGKGRIEFMFMLKKSVLLPQDRGLLPSEADYLRAVEKAARRYIDALEV